MKRGLLVTTLSDVPLKLMGEYVIMAMLTLVHQLTKMRSYQEKKQWPENRFNVCVVVFVP